MKFLEAITLIEEYMEQFDDKWGEPELGTWPLGLYGRYKIMTHILADLRQAIINKEDEMDHLAHLTAACIYWIMSDYNYGPKPKPEHTPVKDSSGGYL